MPSAIGQVAGRSQRTAERSNPSSERGRAPQASRDGRGLLPGGVDLSKVACWGGLCSDQPLHLGSAQAETAPSSSLEHASCPFQPGRRKCQPHLVVDLLTSARSGVADDSALLRNSRSSVRTGNRWPIAPVASSSRSRRSASWWQLWYLFGLRGGGESPSSADRQPGGREPTVL